jgi:hypothetical protein
MATIQQVESKDKETSFGNHKTMPVKKLPTKNIIVNTELPVITDPIDPERISKGSMSKLTKNSAVKAEEVFADTIVNPTFKGSYNMPDVTTGIAFYGYYTYVSDRYGRWWFHRSAGLQDTDWIDISPSNPAFRDSYGGFAQAYSSSFQ